MTTIPKINSAMGTGTQVSDTAQLNKTVNEANSFEKALENAKSTKDNAALMKTCQEFESLFVNMMMKSMRQATLVDEEENQFIEKSFGRGIFEDMRDEELSKKVSQGGGIGIAKMMYKQLSQYNKEEDPTTPVIDAKK